MTTSCDSVDSDRIPNQPVNISLENSGLWNTYGVSGFGSFRNFILSSDVKLPSGFPYTSTSATGFGGVLLIEGLDPFSGSSTALMAYDLACPVERQSNVRVVIDDENYMARCPVCESVYDVTMQRGAPIGGMAATGKYKYALKSYRCVASVSGGYLITN
ncbi:MAG: hypothetical protein J1E78_02520 [Muribaculaceae bacterium]|nr:hypothetical protein [Muribaculaceae bacterium]